jgi:hypothetical protein
MVNDNGIGVWRQIQSCETIEGFEVTFDFEDETPLQPRERLFVEEALRSLRVVLKGTAAWIRCSRSVYHDVEGVEGLRTVLRLIVEPMPRLKTFGRWFDPKKEG